MGQGDPPRAASPRPSRSQPPFLVCRMRFFAFANSMLSGVVIPDRFPQLIWSWRTQLWIAAALTPSSTAAVVIGLPARTSATARIRNSARKGLGMSEASQREPGTHIISGDQTMGYVKKSAKPIAVPFDSLNSGAVPTDLVVCRRELLTHDSGGRHHRAPVGRRCWSTGRCAYIALAVSQERFSPTGRLDRRRCWRA